METRKPREVNFEMDADLDKLVEEMAERWGWAKKRVLNHIIRAYFKRHKGIPEPIAPPE